MEEYWIIHNCMPHQCKVIGSSYIPKNGAGDAVGTLLRLQSLKDSDVEEYLYEWNVIKSYEEAKIQALDSATRRIYQNKMATDKMIAETEELQKMINGFSIQGKPDLSPMKYLISIKGCKCTERGFVGTSKEYKKITYQTSLLRFNENEQENIKYLTSNGFITSKLWANGRGYKYDIKVTEKGVNWLKEHREI